MSIPVQERGSGFHPIPDIGARCMLSASLTPLESFFIYESEPGRIQPKGAKAFEK